MRRKKQAPHICSELGCDKVRFCFGKCSLHFKALSSIERERLTHLCRSERNAEYQKSIIPPEKPRWEWPGDEQALVEMTERQERKKQSAQESA